MEAVPVKTGVVNDGSSFYYYGQDGNRVEKTGMQTLGGAQYYLNSDSTLHEFVPGPNDCEGTVYSMPETEASHLPRTSRAFWSWTARFTR